MYIRSVLLTILHGLLDAIVICGMLHVHTYLCLLAMMDRDLGEIQRSEVLQLLFIGKLKQKSPKIPLQLCEWGAREKLQ